MKLWHIRIKRQEKGILWRWRLHIPRCGCRNDLVLVLQRPCRGNGRRLGHDSHKRNGGGRSPHYHILSYVLSEREYSSFKWNDQFSGIPSGVRAVAHSALQPKPRILRQEQFWIFKISLRGMGQTCRLLLKIKFSKSGFIFKGYSWARIFPLVFKQREYAQIKHPNRVTNLVFRHLNHQVNPTSFKDTLVNI